MFITGRLVLVESFSSAFADSLSEFSKELSYRTYFLTCSSGCLLKDFYQVITSIDVLETTNTRTKVLRTLYIHFFIKKYLGIQFALSALFGKLLYFLNFEVVLIFSVYFIVEIAKCACILFSD